MKTNTWSIVGYTTGALFGIGWAWRYMVLFPDRNIGLLGVMLGVGIVAGAWVYEQIRRLNKLIEEQKETVDSRFTDVYDFIEKEGKHE